MSRKDGMPRSPQALTNQFDRLWDQQVAEDAIAAGADPLDYIKEEA